MQDIRHRTHELRRRAFRDFGGFRSLELNTFDSTSAIANLRAENHSLCTSPVLIDEPSCSGCVCEYTGGSVSPSHRVYACSWRTTRVPLIRRSSCSALALLGT